MIRLETTRLILRDHELGDLESYIAIESDPEYRGPQVVHPRAELERSFRESMMVPKPLGLWATEVRATGRYIGRCGLYPRRTDAGIIVPGELTLGRSRRVVEKLGFTFIGPDPKSRKSGFRTRTRQSCAGWRDLTYDRGHHWLREGH